MFPSMDSSMRCRVLLRTASVGSTKAIQWVKCRFMSVVIFPRTERPHFLKNDWNSRSEYIFTCDGSRADSISLWRFAFFSSPLAR